MAGHVYLIGSRTFSWYKIGKSGNAAIRVTELGILLPFRIEVIAVWRVHNHHEVEKLLHEKYSEQRINGEWFKFNQEEIQKILVGMKGVEVDVGSNYSNIEKDTISKRTETAINAGINVRGGAGTRIDQLTKENHKLKETIQKLLDNQKLPTV